MSITIVTDVFCDICGKWITGATSYKPQVHEARKEARRQGWFRTRSPISGEMADICPNCVEEYGLKRPAAEQADEADFLTAHPQVGDRVRIKPDAFPGSPDRRDQLARGQTGVIVTDLKQLLGDNWIGCYEVELDKPDDGEEDIGIYPVEIAEIEAAA